MHLKFVYPREATFILGNNRQIVCECDGGDHQIVTTNGFALSSQLGPKTRVYACRHEVERKYGDCG